MGYCAPSAIWRSPIAGLLQARITCLEHILCLAAQACALVHRPGVAAVPVSNTRTLCIVSTTRLSKGRKPYFGAEVSTPLPGHCSCSAHSSGLSLGTAAAASTPFHQLHRAAVPGASAVMNFPVEAMAGEEAGHTRAVALLFLWLGIAWQQQGHLQSRNAQCSPGRMFPAPDQKKNISTQQLSVLCLALIFC